MHVLKYLLLGLLCQNGVQKAVGETSPDPCFEVSPAWPGVPNECPEILLPRHLFSLLKREEDVSFEVSLDTLFAHEAKQEILQSMHRGKSLRGASGDRVGTPGQAGDTSKHASGEVSLAWF